MLAVALPKESREATMCKGFGSTLTGPALKWYINLPSRSIPPSRFPAISSWNNLPAAGIWRKPLMASTKSSSTGRNTCKATITRFSQERVVIQKCSIPTAIFAFKRGLLPDGDLYKELTKYQCKTMEDVLSRAWAQVKWEEDVASRANSQQKQDPKTIKDRTEPDEKPSQRPARDFENRNWGRYQNRPIEKAEGMAVSTWPYISHLSVSRPELINVLRQMGQQVKWPQKMKAPDSFWNPGFCIPTAIFAFKRGLLPDGDLYKELTKYQCKTMEDVLSRAWAQVKWEEDVASHANSQQKQDPKTIKDRAEPDEKPSQRPARDFGNRNRGRYQNRPIEKAEGMAVSTWPYISHLSLSRPELINVLRQMGQQVKWPQKMKAPDSFWNPGFWCDFQQHKPSYGLWAFGQEIASGLRGRFSYGLCEIALKSRRECMGSRRIDVLGKLGRYVATEPGSSSVAT
ncbi:hypothetical protein F2Q68_00016753 [Brassica cretica]|uniref:Uncharacterized protein n=1 Tax=Brassica cretica TaxID=69181 RepID=A0A8S9HM12_BRACR|nr:hypothetical protein F2Q68_00016753 [Brassica cretica]